MNTRTCLFLGCLIVLASCGRAQLTTSYNLNDLAEGRKVSVFNREVSPLTDGAKKGLHLSAKPNDGVAWIDGLAFSDGVIELDIRGKDVLQQSFVGVAFHGVDEKTLDAVYFRPFNFQSTDPVRKIHAVQYVSHPDFPWPVLREKFNGKYEKAVSPLVDPNAWFHAKIVVQYPTISVFVNNSTEPSLVVDKLNSRRTGKLGLWVGHNADGDFANLKVTPAAK